MYWYRAQSHQNNLHKVLYGNTHTHTHTHNDCSRNWVLILVGMKILWEEEGFQFGFERSKGWAVSKVLWEWIPNVGSKSREDAKALSLAFVLLDFQHVCQKKSHYAIEWALFDPYIYIYIYRSHPFKTLTISILHKMCERFEYEDKAIYQSTHVNITWVKKIKFCLDSNDFNSTHLCWHKHCDYKRL